MLRRVEFIGSGYEVVRFVMVDTPTMAEAYEAAEKWYKETGQDFHYCEMEIPKEYAYNEIVQGGGNKLRAVPEGRIVVSFANPDYDAAEPYKVFEQERPEENICAVYVFDSPKEFINKWYEMVEDPDGMWYWVIDNEFEYANGEKGVALITSGACDSGDIEIFRDSWRIGALEEDLDAFFEEVDVAPQHATLTMEQREKAKMLHQDLTYDDMSKRDMALVVKYEVEQYKMKADKLFAEGWCSGFVGDIIQAWWDDYRMADGTATALFRYVEEKGKELDIRKSRGNGPLAVEAMMAFKAEAEAVLRGRGLNDVLADASDRASASPAVGRETDLEKY